MREKPQSWLLLVTNLPGRNQTLRMRIWRALKTAGAALLRDGVYLLPDSSAGRRIFEAQRVEIQTRAGNAHVLPFESDSPEQNAAFVALFDRTKDFQAVLAEVDAYNRKLARSTEVDARRRLAGLARDVAAIAAIDFFPGESHGQLRDALGDAEAALTARFAPDEPRPAHRAIARRDPKRYRARTWATREHLWIDRTCSAWLIRRFIDPKAKFLWLKRIQDRPKRAIGFDFDGAEFSHVEAKVTFEVLLASFGLEQDRALVRLGGMVHHLDVGGIPVAESAGFAAIMTGVRALRRGDDALLKSISPVLDSLYAAYTEPGK
jgi:hypothetical protein